MTCEENLNAVRDSLLDSIAHHRANGGGKATNRDFQVFEHAPKTYSETKTLRHILCNILEPRSAPPPRCADRAGCFAVSTPAAIDISCYCFE